MGSKPQYYALSIDPLWDKHEGALDFESESAPEMRSGSREEVALKRLASQAEAVWWLLNLWVGRQNATPSSLLSTQISWNRRLLTLLS